MHQAEAVRKNETTALNATKNIAKFMIATVMLLATLCVASALLLGIFPANSTVLDHHYG